MLKDRFQVRMWERRSRAKDSLCGPIDADQLASERGVARDFNSNALRLTRVIRVRRANDDPCVSGCFLVQANEVPAIQGEKGTILPGGVRENLVIRDSLIRSPRLPRGEDVVPRTAKLEDDGQWKFSFE